MENKPTEEPELTLRNEVACYICGNMMCDKNPLEQAPTGMAIECPEYLKEADVIIAKVKQHEQKDMSERDKIETEIFHYNPGISMKELKELVDKKLSEQKRLDRPALEKDLLGLELVGRVLHGHLYLSKADISKLLALYPDIEELEAVKAEIKELNKKLNDREKDLINAKREERLAIRVQLCPRCQGVLDGQVKA